MALIVGMNAVGRTGGHTTMGAKIREVGGAKDGRIGKDGKTGMTVETTATTDPRPLPALPGIREGAEVGRTKEEEEAAGAGKPLSLHYAKLVTFIQPVRQG